MTNLIAAYQRNEILEFEKIVKVKRVACSCQITVEFLKPSELILKTGSFQSNRRTIMDDPFIRNYIEDLLKNIRTQVLLKLIKPYTRIRIPFISKVGMAFVYISYANYIGPVPTHYFNLIMLMFSYVDNKIYVII